MKHDKLWNDLPEAERKRLMPHMMESQILHIEQCKRKAVNHHKQHIKELNEQIKNIERSLSVLVPFKRK